MLPWMTRMRRMDAPRDRKVNSSTRNTKRMVSRETSRLSVVKESSRSRALVMSPTTRISSPYRAWAMASISSTRA